MGTDYNANVEYDKIIALGQSLCENISGIQRKIKGINKLSSKVKQEITCLQKARQCNKLKKEHISCSNLHHYEAFVKCLLKDEKCISVLEVFHLEDYKCGKKKIYIDIVTEEKKKWRKVIARNPKALSQISKGEGEFQQKSILDHAAEFLACSKLNAILFKPPVVEFYFASGIEKELADELIDMGVMVTGNILGSDEYIEKESTGSMKVNTEILTREITKLNLDVTAMIAYVSALTNGHANVKIRGKVLNQQAEWERMRPMKPVLDNLFRGKDLYACETAISNFKSIVEILGGEGETKRANEFLKRITVVEDSLCQNLKVGGGTRQRALSVFGTGRSIEAITVTGNSAFVRAAQTQGIHFDVFIHEPRALTEGKEIL